VWYNLNVLGERGQGERVRKRRINSTQARSLVIQAREARQQYWEEHAEGLEQRAIELKTKLESLYTDDQVEFERIARTPEYKALSEETAAAIKEWEEFRDNNHPKAAEWKVQERKQRKRKSKKNISEKLEIVDYGAMADVECTTQKIEWSADFATGSLVQTKQGDIGVVMDVHDYHSRVRRPGHISQAMASAYVCLLVNGQQEWHTKLSVEPL
jgi:hypothetical protein